MRRECWERFPRQSASNETTSKRSKHAARHVRHARAVMHVGIAYPRWRGKCSRYSGCMRTRNFMYLARGPCQGVSTRNTTVGGELVLLRFGGTRFAAGHRLMEQFTPTWHLPISACFHGTIWILCCYAMRSGRHPKGSQRPPGRLQVGPGSWLPERYLPDRIA